MQSRPGLVPTRLSRRTRIKSTKGVVLALCLVHAPEGVGSGEVGSQSSRTQSPATEASAGLPPAYIASLPLATQEMVGLLADVALSCDAEALREAVELNELPPDFGDLPRPDGLPPGPIWDPVALWAGVAGPERAAHVVLPFVVLRHLLSSPPARDPTGEPALFVWPAFSQGARSTWSVAQQRFEDRFFGQSHTADQGDTRLNDGPYGGPLLIIDAEGVWHTFSLGNSGAAMLRRDPAALVGGAIGYPECGSTR